jgi:hypothetical protein
MTNYQPHEHDTEHEDGPSNAFWGHSLAAVAVCLGTGSAIAVSAILGWPG